MTTYYDAMFWERFQKTSGKIGVVAFVLVVFASLANGTFDWKVFGLSSIALFLAWANSWILVPAHLRHEKAEDEEWQRYFQSDWRFLDIISELSGTQIDELRGLFLKADQKGVEEFVKRQGFVYSEQDFLQFLRFFVDNMLREIAVYVDAGGTLRQMD